MANPKPPALARDPSRPAAEGWQRQCVASEPRLSELVETYRQLGFEVLQVPVSQECAVEGDAEGCTACFADAADPDRYQVIYTRPTAGRKGELEGLF